LFVPANLDILPLLAIAARDFASFAEPEGLERPRAPFLVYDDEGWDGDSEGMEEMQHLLHPAWFQRLGMSLPQAVSQFRPENCIIMGDPRQIARRLTPLPEPFSRVVHFRRLAVEGGVAPGTLPGEAVAADDLLERKSTRWAAKSTAAWKGEHVATASRRG
jgi:hypothetical protein